MNDFEQLKTKYDKIVLDNLLVPGIVGMSCPYKNLSDYINNNSLEISKMKMEKEELKRENKELKVKIDGMMKSIINLVDKASRSCNEYSDKKKQELELLLESKIAEFEKKANELKSIANLIQTNNDKQITDLKYDINCLLQLKEELNMNTNDKINNEKKSILEEMTKKFKVVDDGLGEMKKELNEISKTSHNQMRDINYKLSELSWRINKSNLNNNSTTNTNNNNYGSSYNNTNYNSISKNINSQKNVIGVRRISQIAPPSYKKNMKIFKEGKEGTMEKKEDNELKNVTKKKTSFFVNLKSNSGSEDEENSEKEKEIVRKIYKKITKKMLKIQDPESRSLSNENLVKIREEVKAAEEEGEKVENKGEKENEVNTHVTPLSTNLTTLQKQTSSSPQNYTHPKPHNQPKNQHKNSLKKESITAVNSLKKEEFLVNLKKQNLKNPQKNSEINSELNTINTVKTVVNKSNNYLEDKNEFEFEKRERQFKEVNYSQNNAKNKVRLNEKLAFSAEHTPYNKTNFRQNNPNFNKNALNINVDLDSDNVVDYKVVKIDLLDTSFNNVPQTLSKGNRKNLKSENNQNLSDNENTLNVLYKNFYKNHKKSKNRDIMNTLVKYNGQIVKKKGKNELVPMKIKAIFGRTAYDFYNKKEIYDNILSKKDSNNNNKNRQYPAKIDIPTNEYYV